MDMMDIRRRVLLGIKSQGTYVYRIDNVPHGAVANGIDTGIMLNDVDKDWTILCDVSFVGSTLTPNGSYSMQGGYKDCGIIRDNPNITSASSQVYFGFYQNYANTYWMEGRKFVFNSASLDFINPDPRRYAFYHKAGESCAHLNLCGHEYTTPTKTFVANNNHVYVRPSVSDEFLINQVLIYEKQLTADEISAYITGKVIP